MAVYVTCTTKGPRPAFSATTIAVEVLDEVVLVVEVLAELVASSVLGAAVELAAGSFGRGTAAFALKTKAALLKGPFTGFTAMRALQSLVDALAIL